MSAAWLYAGGALLFFVIGLVGGGVFFYIIAALWAVHCYRAQRFAWEEEDRDRASTGGDGEDSG